MIPRVSGTLGKYQIQGTLGQGAYGIVYYGWQADLQRPVAIKELGPNLVGDPGFIQQFRAEAQIMARLDHPNCVKVFDFIETSGRAFLVSEYVDGASLRRIIQTSGALSPQQSLGVLKGALHGLGYAHSLGLTHRDVKPENILADREGVSKLVDFGQAVFAHGPGAAGGLTGSPAYMSPEQVQGGICDARSDLYSAGVILYEFLAGRPPFVAENAVAVMRMQVNDLPQDPRVYNPQLPAEASAMLARAIAKDPSQRFQSAAEMLVALEGAAVVGYGRDWERSSAIKALVAGALAVGAGVAGAAVVSAAGAGAATAGGATAGVGGAAGGTAAGSATVATATTGSGISGGVIAGGVGVGVIATAAVVGYVVLTNAVFGHNLVVNGDAEASTGVTSDTQVAAPQGWTTRGPFTVVQYGANAFPTAQDPGPPDRGKNFFAGGPGATQSSAAQTIDVGSGGGGIDSGSKKYDLSAYLGGTRDEGDSITVVVTFEDANGNPVGSATIGPVTEIGRRSQTGLIKSETKGAVPSGTRKVKVEIRSTRVVGNYNDGYADDVSLTIT
jgi:hypothetical protein